MARDLAVSVCIFLMWAIAATIVSGENGFTLKGLITLLLTGHIHLVITRWIANGGLDADEEDE